MREESSVAVELRRWRDAFVTAFVGLLAIKLLIACTLSPFGDEAFYWMESRRLAWGYSDLPPLTAWLIRLGESIAGHSLIGMRWPFLLLGGVLPWLVVWFAREAFDRRAGWQAGLLCLALPLAGSLGVLALPDVPLTVAIMLAMLALLRAMRGNRLSDWMLLGSALGMAWATHYRAAMAMLAGLLLLLVTERGRLQWRRGGLWLALLLAALGLVPLAISNWQQRGAGIAFQLVERNAWQFQVDALVQPLEQAVACTPLLYGMLLWAAWMCWRRRKEGAPWDLIAVVSLSFIVLYFVLGLFADDLRFRAHWPLPGYLPLLAALPVLWRAQAQKRGWRRFAWLAFALAAIGQLSGMAYLGLAASRDGAAALASFKAFPSNFVGWRESGDSARELLRDKPAVLVADNFMLAAELDFQLGAERPVYSLDSPLNVKHGRAPQLTAWRLDETGLRNAHAGEPVLLAVDETALRERERAAWLGTVCNRLIEIQSLTRLDLFAGRKRIAFYAARVPEASSSSAPADPAHCLVWQRAVAP
ncbi:glycosyltransferase family 39 protein [Dyella sp. GSA-30]|uniref:ArnT family glycosyltransferase n=1 Tax=Dyella sp. GSA-30 TaxID=2994496 RepID=UPI00249327F1|nr:glycosyltransferase family 39 protein [Dyella sp. GSA-30]